jgi:sporulation protein YlmC with PRC-barrel domain
MQHTDSRQTIVFQTSLPWILDGTLHAEEFRSDSMTLKGYQQDKQRTQVILMNAKLMSLAGAVTVCALTFPVHAAERTNTTRYTTRDSGRDAQAERLGQVVKASDVIGKEVKNRQDEKLGKVEDMAVDVETGRIIQVIVSSGGVLGVGDRVVAVPPTAFTCEPPHPTLRLDATKDKLKGAPEVDLSKWDDLTQTNRVLEGYRYFGKEPYFTGTRRSNEPRYSTTGYGTIERASKVIGAAVKNQTDEKLGKVDNLMVDLEAGRIVHVILSSGGFLGVGDDLTPMPPSAFRYTATDNILVAKATKDALTRGPRFKTSEWPDFGDASYSAGVYRAYEVEPYFDVNADNTRRNVRDRDGRNLTPVDQGTSEADVDMTRRIRQGIMDQQNLSVNARNVKVITLNGGVTLRGPVNDAAEKRSIEEIVQRVAPNAKVDNQLEVKQPANR